MNKVVSVPGDPAFSLVFLMPSRPHLGVLSAL